ncbi:MAG TPA: DnaJ domain-containing protein [Candidatus Acidoferrum sp.]|nr:DnaJ domain-containing protein [Candidatus Acidoferrum sp.]
MARPLDPFRTLEVPRDASLDEVKASYRRLAKLYHPDSAGDRALPRFLAIQAAYEALTEGPASLRLGKGTRARSAGARSANPRPPRPSEADAERSRATREAAGRSRTRSGTGSGPETSGGGPARGGAAASTNGSRGPAGSTGSGGPRAAGGRAGGTSTGRARRDRRPPNSTSYDGADLEPFEPEWQGASWYGESSGTYWTINPKEFADPRKHGPEYQARGRRATRGERAGPRAFGAAKRSRPTGGPDTEAPGEPTTDGADGSPRPGANDRGPYAEATGGARPPDETQRHQPDDDPASFRPPDEDRDAARPTFEPGDPTPLSPAAAISARPPFAVLGVFGIMLGAIAAILVLSPAGPAAAGFVPAIFLIAILASAGLVLSGIGGSRRA